MAQQIASRLDLDLTEIQGDLLVGMQKNAELFLFFKITDPHRFKAGLTKHVARRVTSALVVHQREQRVSERRREHQARTEAWMALNLGFTQEGSISASPRRV